MRRLCALVALGALLAGWPGATLAAAAASPTRTPGIAVGPPRRSASTTSARAAQTVSSSGATGVAFWDLPGQVEDSIDGWFRSVATDTLSPTLRLVGETVLATPPLAANAEIAGLWQIALIAADGMLVLCLLVAAGIVISHDTLHSRYALKDLLARLAFTAIVVNASLSLVDQLAAVANALASAFLGDGASAVAAGASLRNAAVSALAGGGIFLTLLGLACAVVAVCLLMLYLLRAAIVVALACAAPLVLLAHLFPQTEGLAHLWWRLLAAAFGVQVIQALLLAACVRVFFAGGAPGLGLSAGGSVVDLLLCLALLTVMVKVPLWAREFAFGRRGGDGARIVRSVAIVRLARVIS